MAALSDKVVDYNPILGELSTNRRLNEQLITPLSTDNILCYYPVKYNKVHHVRVA